MTRSRDVANIDTILTTKGDIYAASAAYTPARVAVGTNGQILIADSTTASGVRWGTPSFTGCALYKTAVQTINNTTDTSITFNAEDVDTNGFHDNSTNNTRITIPSGFAGKYEISWSVQWPSTGVGSGTASFILLKNGSTYCEQYDTGSSWFCQTGSRVMDLAVSDYLELRVYHNAGSARDIQILGNSRATTFSAQFLG